MRRSYLLAGVALVLTSGLALAQPESLLPPGFDDPAPAQAPAPAPTARPTVIPTLAPVSPQEEEPGVEPLPELFGSGFDGGSPISTVELPEDFPTIEELEAMSSDDVDELLGLKPKFDIPAAARRATSHIGVIDSGEGGFALASFAGQPVSLVRAALEGTRHPVVSRWGHILLRRTLASRLDAPEGMDAVEFAALRAAVLNRMGESYAARALVQDVDSSNYSAALADAAFDAYVATGDITGMCPVARLKSDLRKDPQWQMTRSICRSYAGGAREASQELSRALSREIAPRIDVLLAQRYAGAAAEGGRAVNIEWDDVSQLNPWRYSLSVALGVEVPESLREGAGPWYDRVDALSPALGLAARADAADRAGREGIFSSAAMVDLYGLIYSDRGISGDASLRATLLREAYVAQAPADRMEAMRNLWAGERADYGRLVLTAYAAARIPPSNEFQDDAPRLIASMLAAGLDRNAMRWTGQVSEGSEAWALLALAQPNRNGTVQAGAVDSYLDNDTSADQRKSRFFIAGLAGLERIDSDALETSANRLGLDLGRESAWSRMITRAAEVNNPALVSLLAGLGMQGNSWDMMTARHLYLIVRSLNQVGLQAEARMIAAEALARG